MTLRVMLDSGAFTVWNKGDSIDLDDYISYCRKYPKASCFVNLDVIPGVPNNKRSLTPENIESSCRQGWKNYQKMLKVLPFEKVVPVFHQNDSYKWLERYLDFGSPYIGISPANDRTTSEKLRWLKDVSQYVLDSEGAPIVKMHGFAVTSYDLMRFWQWHSVDSASWILVAGYGGIWVPKTSNGVWDYSKDPHIVACSPNSPKTSQRHTHLNTLGVQARRQVLKFLSDHKTSLGHFEILRVEPDHQLADDELWYGSRNDRKESTPEIRKQSGFGLKIEHDRKRSIIKILEKGVVTSMQKRAFINVRFLQKANKVLPVEHIYFAGGSGAKMSIERNLKRRLFTYALLRTSSGFQKRFEMHLDMIGENE